MSSLGVGAATILTARETIFHFFRSLPICLFITIGLFGAVQGNANYILFATGLGLGAPAAAVCLNMLFEFIFTKIDGWTENTTHSYWLIPNGASCTLFEVLSKNPLSPMNGVPTVWTVMIAFFFTYIFTNALTIYNYDVPSKADPTLVAARKTRCVMSMIFIVAFFIIVLIGRLSIMHCETALGLIIGLLTGGTLGYYWYIFASSCGLGQFDDIFGISNRLLSSVAAGNSAPQICVPVAK
jgi:hypothetical protein